MRKRCLDPKHKKYSDYGGRGITVCDEWQNSFEAFFAYVGPKPEGKYSLDRIDNDKGYFPGNVRWATDSEQNSNRRSNWEPHEPDQIKWLCSLGYSLREIARFFGVDHKTIARVST